MGGGCRIVIVAILFVLLLLQFPLNVDASSIQVEESDGWRIIKTSDLTVMFTANGSHPMFIWWRNDSNNTRYLVDFKGLWEYFVVGPTLSPFKKAYVANITNINVTLVKPIVDESISLSSYVDEAVKVINRYEDAGVNVEAFKNQVVAVTFKVDDVIQGVESYNTSVNTLGDAIRSLRIRYRDFDPYVHVNRSTINELLLNLGELSLILSHMASLNVTAISLYTEQIDERIARLSGLISDLSSQFEGLNESVNNLIAGEHCSSCINVMRATRSECLASLNNLVDSFNELSVFIEQFNLDVKAFMSGGEVDVDSELLILNDLLATVNPIVWALDSPCKSIVERVKECVEGSVENYLNRRVSIAKDLVELKSRLLALKTDINSMVDNIVENTTQLMESMHPPFLSFQECKWSLTDVEYISLGDGEVIGVAFTYMLKSAPSRFEFAEGNIMIRCRFYTSPVVEKVDGVEYRVSRAELKMDFIVQKWRWTVPMVRNVVTQAVSEGVNTTIVSPFSALALWVNLASINMTRVGDVWYGRYGRDISASNVISLKNLNLNININVEARDEVEIKLLRGIPVTFNFISGGKVLAGFFKFISEAIVRYSNGTDNIIDVYASCLEAPGFLKLFICYPYFSDGVLEHDPSIGVKVEEKQPVAEVSISATSESKPYIASIEVKPLIQVVSPTVSTPVETSPTTTPEGAATSTGILIAIAAVVIAAILIVFLRRKKST